MNGGRREKTSSQHAMSSLAACMEGYGPAVNGPKYAFLELMDLSDTASQVYGPRIAFSKLMDLSDTPSQVYGPLAHFTQRKNMKPGQREE
jgi:hypothetical protein